jgi:hypothetical protein
MIKYCLTCKNNKPLTSECLVANYDPVDEWLVDNAEPWDSKNHCPENPKCDCPGYQDVSLSSDFKEGDYVIVINTVNSSNLLKFYDVWQAVKPRSLQPEEWFFKKITGSKLKCEISFFCSHFRKVTPVEMAELISSGIVLEKKELQMPVKEEPMKRFMVLAKCDIECYKQFSNVVDALSAAEKLAKLNNQVDYYVVEVTHSVISKIETLSLNKADNSEIS